MNNDWKKWNTSALIAKGKLFIGDGYRAKNSELSSSGLPFARVSNIDGGFNFTDVDRFPVRNLAKVKDKVSQPGDTVFTSKGTVGRFAYVTEETEQFVYSPQLCYWRSLDASLILPRFLYYWLNGREFWLQVNGVKGQTDMADYVSLSDQRKMFISIPSLAEQRAIAHILGSLDDKIELNRQMNRTLEEMARAIFKSWFVDFDPVHAKARGEQPTGMDAATAALFPNSFEETELGLVPRGWRVGTIGDIAQNSRRGADPNNLSADTPYIGLEHMPQRSIALSEWGKSGAVTSGKFHFEQWDILFGKLRPYFHKVGIAPSAGICSTDILVITEKEQHWFGLVLGHLSSTTFVDYASAVSTGTRMPRTNWSDMACFPIPIPNDDLALRLTEIVKPLIELIISNIYESRTLAELRDTLLPKLMSGQLRVPEAVEMV
jgi:type I restriction enzyme, S subunit